MKKTEERIKNILEYDRMYDVENWIEYIKECTFKTEFIPISSEETKHFLKFIQEGKKSSNETLNIIEELKIKINEVLNKILKDNIDDGVFIRFGPRR